MKFAGLIQRRLLVNWRVDPDTARALLPPAVRPKLIRGYAVAGLCFIHLQRVRPVGLPQWLSVNSENVAARMAVETDAGESVIIFRRDTGSWINAAAGGRLFPGIHHRANFLVHQDASRVAVTMRSADGTHTLDIAAREATTISPNSVFHSLDEASSFFRGGEAGYAPARTPGTWVGVRLQCSHWKLQPMTPEHVVSSFIQDPLAFPPATATLDSIFIMRNVPHTWTVLPSVHWGIPAGRFADPSLDPILN
jgi:hypothetical protein